MDMPTTTTRVPRHTAADVNDEIRRRMELNILYYGRLGPRAITRRLVELDHEWDIERTLEANAAIVSVTVDGMYSRHSWQGFSCNMPCRDGVRRFRCFVVWGSAPPGRSTMSGTPLKGSAATSTWFPRQRR